MACTRHIIVCEGESEWTYLQRLQGFLDQQPLADGAFEPPLLLIAPMQAIAKGGKFSTLKNQYSATRIGNRRSSILIWADFDLYHRNDNRCADDYARKTAGIPDFLFSYHNFEDFYALHADGDRFQDWLRFGAEGHFATPLHSAGYLPEIRRIFPGYGKGDLPADFISWDSLRNLKRNKCHHPRSNPHHLQGLGCFADFLIGEIERAYPGALNPPAPAPP
jgi:hypothetical protein